MNQNNLMSITEKLKYEKTIFLFDERKIMVNNSVLCQKRIKVLSLYFIGWGSTQTFFCDFFKFVNLVQTYVCRENNVITQTVPISW